jgi:hypothetical protein
MEAKGKSYKRWPSVVKGDKIIRRAYCLWGVEREAIRNAEFRGALVQFSGIISLYVSRSSCVVLFYGADIPFPLKSVAFGRIAWVRYRPNEKCLHMTTVPGNPAEAKILILGTSCRCVINATLRLFCLQEESLRYLFEAEWTSEPVCRLTVRASTSPLYIFNVYYTIFRFRIIRKSIIPLPLSQATTVMPFPFSI